jgi:hypothetical protein
MPAQVVEHAETSSLPILIVDHEGSIGLALYEQLRGYVQTVLVGSRQPVHSDNLLFLPFKEAISRIPEDPYSHILYIPVSEKELFDYLSSMAKKANIDGALLLVMIPLSIASSSVLEKIQMTEGKISILVLGDIFGEPFTQKDLRISKMFSQIKYSRHITLAGMGMEELFAVSFMAIIKQIIQIAFGIASPKKVYLSYPKHPLTQLSVVHSLQKLDPMITLDFLPQENNQSLAARGQEITGEYLTAENHEIFTQLQDAYNTHKVYIEEAIEQTPIALPKKKEMQGSFWKDIKTNGDNNHTFSWLHLFILFVIISLLIPIIMVIVGLTGGGVFMNSAKASLEKGNYEQVNQRVSFSRSAFGLANISSQVLSFELQPIGLSSVVNNIKETIRVGNIGNDVLVSVIGVVTDLQSSNSHLSQSISRLKNSLNQLASVENSPVLPANIRSLLQSTKNTRTLFLNTSDILPTLLGDGEKKTYLVLFQNNNELRPGGGFIGSYALIDVKNGKMTDIKIYDVYDADGQLKGHIEPAFAIRRYVPSAHLYLRDSNFDVDFTKNASTAAFLLQKEMGNHVDGVVGVDLSFVKNLIGAVGDVYVPEYQETVTKDNFSTLAQDHSEKNFFPGSTQKKDFLKSVFTVLQEKLQSGKSLDYAQLVNALVSGIAEKHILVSFSNSAVQDVLTANNFSSSLWDGRVQTDNTINDFLGISEANLGVNKVNYFVTRSMQEQVVIDGGGNVSHVLSLNYENNSKPIDKYAGSYKNYLRVILPGGASITDITIDGSSEKIIPAITDFLVYEKSNFTVPDGLEVSREEESGKTIYGFLTTVDPGKKQNIIISYSLAQKMDVTKPVGMYSLKIFKQPGIDTTPFSFALTYPSVYAVLQTSSGLVTGPTVTMQQDLKTDEILDITLGKK